MGSLGGNTTSNNKPHAVLIPFPAQGHIVPTTKLAKLLHNRGFHITFVHTEYNYRRLLRSHGPGSLDGLPSFRFMTIPDGLPFTDADVTQDIPAICDSMDKNSAMPFKQLLEKLANDAADNNNEVPPVTCVISDGALQFTIDVAEEMDIKFVQFWTASVCGFVGYAQYAPLIERGIVPFKDTSCLTNGYMDNVIEWAPESLNGIRLKDIPTFIRTTEPKDIMLNYLVSLIKNATRAAAIIFNTFDALETQFLTTLTPSFPPLYTCGPFNLLLDQINDNNTTQSKIHSNLWKEDDKCIDWLNTKDPESVVYVNFGSITVMTNHQLLEFAWGLAKSGKHFLWIIRPDLVSGETAILPTEFLTQTKHRSLLSNWCDQERVLNHPAIGGFLTHSGWNSTLESICSGVPMICWPFFAEQQTNSWYCGELGIAMEIDPEVKRDEVAHQITELMDSHKGREMKRKVNHWKNLAYQAVTPSNKTTRDNSLSNFDKLVNEVLLSPKK